MSESVRPPAMQDPKQYITKEQALAAIAATSNQRDEIMLSLLWYTGARISEILNLEIQYINFREGSITIQSLKQKHLVHRSVPIPDQLLAKIYAYIKSGGNQGCKYLLTYDGKRPMSRQLAYNIVRKACENAGVTEFGDPNISKRGMKPHPHVFRHGFAMNWYRQGGRAEVLQEILGHRSYETTRSYQRFTAEDIKRDYDQIHKETA